MCLILIPLIFPLQQSGLEQIQKFANIDYLFMPTWTFSELEECVILLGSTKDRSTLANRFSILGGSARLVLDVLDKFPDAHKAIRIAANNCSSLDLLHLIKMNPSVASYAQAGRSIATLVHLQVDTTGTNAYREGSLKYKFASDSAEDTVIRRIREEREQETRWLVFQTFSNRAKGSFYGDINDRFLNYDIADGGKFTVEDLNNHDRFVVEFPRRTTCPYGQITDIPLDAQQNYYIPDKSTEAAVDAIMPPRLGVQITVAETHVIKYEPMKAIMTHFVRLTLLLLA